MLLESDYKGKLQVPSSFGGYEVEKVALYVIGTQIDDVGKKCIPAGGDNVDYVRGIWVRLGNYEVRTGNYAECRVTNDRRRLPCAVFDLSPSAHSYPTYRYLNQDIIAEILDDNKHRISGGYATDRCNKRVLTMNSVREISELRAAGAGRQPSKPFCEDGQTKVGILYPKSENVQTGGFAEYYYICVPTEATLTVVNFEIKDSTNNEVSTHNYNYNIKLKPGLNMLNGKSSFSSDTFGYGKTYTIKMSATVGGVVYHDTAEFKIK